MMPICHLVVLYIFLLYIVLFVLFSYFNLITLWYIVTMVVDMSYLPRSRGIPVIIFLFSSTIFSFVILFSTTRTTSYGKLGTRPDDKCNCNAFRGFRNQLSCSYFGSHVFTCVIPCLALYFSWVTFITFPL